MPSVVNIIKHLYTALLRLYPPRFRAEFAEEMQEVFVDAMIEARERSVSAVFQIITRELKDMPMSLGREYWHAFTRMEGTMDRIIEANGGLVEEGSSAPVGVTQAPWRQAVLAGLPHLLYPLSIEVPTLVWALLTTGNVSFNFLRDNFWVLVVVALVFGWRLKWPHWSASWVGYGLVIAFGILIDTAQTYYGALLENVAVLIWLVLTAAVFFWMTRRDWLSGLLVLLPVVPMFFTFIGLDGVKGTVPEGLYFIAVGLLMMLVVIAIVRTGNLRAGIWLVLAAFIVITLPVSYATTYHSNVPVRFAYVPTVSDMVRTFLISVIVFVIFAAPLWSLALWTKGRRWLARNKAA
ncbi:MAG: hypothetical protein MUO67_22395 [Anaerolineales bacterium]|nr:hypothetical protein [Anaerolineales bacterium]